MATGVAFWLASFSRAMRIRRRISAGSDTALDDKSVAACAPEAPATAGWTGPFKSACARVLGKVARETMAQVNAGLRS